MNGSTIRTTRSQVKSVALAVALALSGATAFAESMSTVVTTRSDQTIAQQYGRDSVYAFSPGSKPFTPGQTASHMLENVKAYSAVAWHKTTELLAPKPGSAAQNEPQRYGRAGGYVGADQIAFLRSNVTSAAAWQTSVKTGEVESNDAADAREHSGAMGRDSSTQPEAHNGRTDGNRFDNSDGTHGQNSQNDMSDGLTMRSDDRSATPTNPGDPTDELRNRDNRKQQQDAARRLPEPTDEDEN